MSCASSPRYTCFSEFGDPDPLGRHRFTCERRLSNNMLVAVICFAKASISIWKCGSFKSAAHVNLRRSHSENHPSRQHSHSDQKSRCTWSASAAENPYRGGHKPVINFQGQDVNLTSRRAQTADPTSKVAL